jgi:hypothetical protein
MDIRLITRHDYEISATCTTKIDERTIVDIESEESYFVGLDRCSIQCAGAETFKPFLHFSDGGLISSVGIKVPHSAPSESRIKDNRVKNLKSKQPLNELAILKEKQLQQRFLSFFIRVQFGFLFHLVRGKKIRRKLEKAFFFSTRI